MGEIGPSARQFIQTLQQAGQRYWQVLPLGPTGYADSPYQALSTFAGNPMLISFDDLMEDGLLKREELGDVPDFPRHRVDYGPVLEFRQGVLNQVCKCFSRRASAELNAEFKAFCKKEAGWLDDYALFVALKEENGLRPWIEWAPEFVHRDAEALKAFGKEKASDIRRAKLRQFLFSHQWHRLRTVVEAPGEVLFSVLQRELGEIPVIAEDLGVITEDVDALRDRFELPGMRILQFSFADDLKPHMKPEGFPENCVVYTGTHDNDTTVGWFWREAGVSNTEKAEDIEVERHAVLDTVHTDGSQIHWDLIALAHRLAPHTAIVPLQDVMELGTEARMNVPGRMDGTWAWRFDWPELRPEDLQRLRDITEWAGRI